MAKMAVEEVATGFPADQAEQAMTRHARERQCPCSEGEAIRIRRVGQIDRDSALVSLKEENGDRRLPICVARREGEEIARGLRAAQTLRPMTHDLLATIITKMGGQVEQVIVSRIEGSCFHALIAVGTPGGPLKIDSRPSDAIALAVRVHAPIYCEEAVLEEAGQRWSPDWQWDPERRPASILWSASAGQA